MVVLPLTEITRAATLAWNLYQLGWGSELAADEHYNEFGDDIKSLAECLDNVKCIVQNASRTWQQQSLRSSHPRGTDMPKEWDLQSIPEIVGDYKATLQDCKKLIEENPEFRTGSGPRYNLQWNLIIRSKVEHLQKRLSAHNTKILILLKPLELSLLSDVQNGLSLVHQDLANRLDIVHQSVMHLQGLLIPDVTQAISELEQIPNIPIDVPEDVEARFLAAAEKSHPEVRNPGQFPLKAASNAFVAHYEESTKCFQAGRFLTDRTPTAKQYLSLLKCIWILKRIRGSEEFSESQTSPDSQWSGYINQLHENIYVECQRFSSRSAQKLLAPNIENSMEDPNYEIWIEDDLTSFLSPHIETRLPPVLEFPLLRPRESVHRTVTVHPIDKSRYKFIETIHDSNLPAAQSRSLEMDIDLRTLSFIPLYAVPSSRPKALEVMLDSGSQKVTPEFQDIKHIYRLQHLLTGYKIYDRYDQERVKVTFAVSGEHFETEEYGRVQLWVPRHFTQSTPEGSQLAFDLNTRGNMAHMSEHRNSRRTSLSSKVGFSIDTLGQTPRISRTKLSPTSLSNNLRPNSMSDSILPARGLPTVRKTDGLTTTSTSLSQLPSKTNLRSPTTPSSRTSRTDLTSNSTMSRNTMSTVTTISTSKSSRARLHLKPMKPMLVIFLKSRDSPTRLSVVSIQVDDGTNVIRERCSCRSSNSQCRISCIERNGGYLLAQRWEANNSSSGFDLAKLGTYQRKDSENTWNQVKRLSLKFETWEDRYRFAGSPCSCKIRTSHDLSNCNLLSHNGCFGIVRQVGMQSLYNYHNERDRTTSIVTGELPEEDEFHLH